MGSTCLPAKSSRQVRYALHARITQIALPNKTISGPTAYHGVFTAGFDESRRVLLGGDVRVLCGHCSRELHRRRDGDARNRWASIGSYNFWNVDPALVRDAFKVPEVMKVAARRFLLQVGRGVQAQPAQQLGLAFDKMMHAVALAE